MVDPSADYKRADVKRARRFGLLEKKGLSGYLFILPFLIGFFAIFLGAVGTSFIYAFSNVNIGFGEVTTSIPYWNGSPNIFANFLQAFEDAIFITVFLQLGSGLITDIIVVICFSFFISNVLNQKFIGRGAARMVFFLPVLVTTGINIMLMEQVAVLDAGVLGADQGGSGLGFGWAMFQTEMLMDRFGIPSDPVFGFDFYNLILTAILNIDNIVNESGVQILIFLSALQSISPALFEAAKVEGATKWEEFWKITFPMLTPMILVAVVYSIIATFTNPRYGILSLVTGTFDSGQHGYASAIAWLYFALIMAILGLVWLIIARRVNYLE